ncbi:alpha-galactosidase [Paenibacillus silviterrae]|uniref:alpha-galactosidase n=1 Tax=Paenibacillus silviterrae TaxID=3242194 RepID=UPI002542AA19|nr:alpha-galactosidase [Paenibacillus chinjuensis]
MDSVMTWEDCYVGIEGSVLRIGNSRIERSWSFAYGRPVNVSVLDKQRGKEWLREGSKAALFGVPWMPAGSRLTVVSANTSVDDDCGVGRSHLRTDVDMLFGGMSRFVRLTVRVYPEGAFIRHELTLLPEDVIAVQGGFAIPVESSDVTAGVGTAPALQLDDNHKQQSSGNNDYCDRLDLQELHCRWETVSFRDRTDVNNNLVSRESGLLYKNEQRGLRGNILMLRNSLQGSGLLLIKESATPLGHVQDRGLDLHFQGICLSVVGTGFDADTLAQQEEVTSYGVTVGVYDGDKLNGYELIHQYHRCLREFHAERDSFVMSNTWGDRSRDGRVCEEFLLAELHAASRLGIDVVQIDDGWQKGVTTNSVNAKTAGGRWSDYYNGGGDFWTVHPERFPRGLVPVTELAKQLRIKLGLWYSPDSENDFANWEKDIETLLRLHREHGVCMFKMDGVHIRSKLGESRFVRILRQVVRETGGQVDFNLDTTSQQRLGYLGKTQYGNLFLENRYTDWKNYYPHWTLRNLWMLSPFVPSSKLQMEFLNVNRNKELYAGDPLAPAACGQVYSYAVTAFANPLAWMELTGLDAAQTAALSAVIQAIKPYHKDILAGHVLPIGDEPTGTGWTGLQSLQGDDSGYLLVIRELNPSSTRMLKLWGLGSCEALRLSEIVRMDSKDQVIIPQCHEEASAKLLKPDSRGEFSFTRPAPFSFTVYRYAASR